MTLQEKLKAKADIVGRMKALNDGVEGRAFNEAEETEWQDLNQRHDALESEINTDNSVAQRSQRLSEIEANANRRYDLPGTQRETRENAIDDKTVSAAIRGWAAGRRASRSDVDAAQRVGIDSFSNEIELRLMPTACQTREAIRENRAAMNTQQPSAGGFLVVPEFASTFEQALLDYSSIRQVATTVRTTTGATMTFPTVDDTGNEGEWTAYDQEASQQDMTIGGRTLGAHGLSSKYVAIDRDLLQDNSYNLIGALGPMLGERCGRAEARATTTGTGVGQPLGFLNQTTLGKTATGTTDVTLDEIIDLIGSVGTAYAARGNFMMHRLIKYGLRKKKGGDGHYLWEPSLQAGIPDTLMGYRIVNNDYMPSTFTSTYKIIAFGDFSKYLIRDVSSITIQRFVEIRGLKNQDAFVARMRVDGATLIAGTSSDTVPIKHLALA